MGLGRGKPEGRRKAIETVEEEEWGEGCGEKKREKEPKRKRGRMPIKQARTQEERARVPVKSQGGDTHGYNEGARSLSRRHP